MSEINTFLVPPPFKEIALKGIEAYSADDTTTFISCVKNSYRPILYHLIKQLSKTTTISEITKTGIWLKLITYCDVGDFLNSYIFEAKDKKNHAYLRITPLLLLLNLLSYTDHSDNILRTILLEFKSLGKININIGSTTTLMYGLKHGFNQKVMYFYVTVFNDPCSKCCDQITQWIKTPKLYIYYPLEEYLLSHVIPVPTNQNELESVKSQLVQTQKTVVLMELELKQWKKTYTYNQELLEVNLTQSYKDIFQLEEKCSDLSTQLKKVQEEMNDLHCMI